jgi:hypothetical protein
MLNYISSAITLTRIYSPYPLAFLEFYLCVEAIWRQQPYILKSEEILLTRIAVAITQYYTYASKRRRKKIRSIQASRKVNDSIHHAQTSAI